MRFEITKAFRFEGAHSLPHLPKTHQCHRVHGHSYEIIVGVSGKLTSDHWVQEYGEISDKMKPLIEKLDHRNLNDVLNEPTTAENLAMWFWKKLSVALPLLSRIEVRETPTSNVILTK